MRKEFKVVVDIDEEKFEKYRQESIESAKHPTMKKTAERLCTINNLLLGDLNTSIYAKLYDSPRGFKLVGVEEIK